MSCGHKHSEYAGGGMVLLLIAASFWLFLVNFTATYDTRCALVALQRDAAAHHTSGIVHLSCTLTMSDGSVVVLRGLNP